MIVALLPPRHAASGRAPAITCYPVLCATAPHRYGTVKESEADQMLRNKALIIDEIESTLTDAVVQDLNSRWDGSQSSSFFKTYVVITKCVCGLHAVVHASALPAAKRRR